MNTLVPELHFDEKYRIDYDCCSTSPDATGAFVKASIFCAIVLCIFLWPIAVFAEWDETFADDSLPDELREVRIVVVTGGPGAAEVGGLLVEELQAQEAPMAMLNPVFDDLEGRDDYDAVEEVAHLPVEVVVVLRTFDDDEDATPEQGATSGMMTIYSAEGQALAGFVIYPGQQLTREQRQQAGRGISQKTLDATVDAVEGRASGGQRQRQRNYQVEGSGRSMLLRDNRQDENITGVDIYHFLDDEELVTQYERNARGISIRRRMWFTAVGLGAVVAGVGTGVGQYNRRRSLDDNDPNLTACDAYTNDRVRQNCRAEAHRSFYDNYETRVIVAMSVAGAGLLIGVGAGMGGWATSLRSAHPLSRTELQRRVNELERRESEPEGGLDSSDSSEETALREPFPSTRAVGVTPYFDAADDVRGGLAIWMTW